MNAVVTVAGKDQVGIIAAVCNKLAEHNVNVQDISQTVLKGYFTMLMIVDISQANAPLDVLAGAMEELGKSRGLSIRMQREDIFEAMHHI